MTLIGAPSGERALSASRELRGERRLPAADYLITAAAAERGFAVMHYDHHFDPLCRILGIEKRVGHRARIDRLIHQPPVYLEAQSRPLW